MAKLGVVIAVAEADENGGDVVWRCCGAAVALIAVPVGPGCSSKLRRCVSHSLAKRAASA